MFSYASVSCFEQRPPQQARYLVERNIQKLVALSIRQATQFVNTSQSKLKGLEQLKYTVLLGQSSITKHVEVIMKSLVKIWQMDIDHSHPIIHKIVQILGYSVRTDYYVPLITNILAQQQYKNSQKNTIIMLNLLGHLLKNTPELEQHLEIILKLVQHYQGIFYENDEGIISISEIVTTLIHRSNHIENQMFRNVAYTILLDVISTQSIPTLNKTNAEKLIKQLSVKTGFQTVAELHAHQIGPILERMVKQKNYMKWNRSTKDRFKFDTIVRNCHSEVGRFINEIVQVLEWMINPHSELELRIDTLVLIEHMMTIQPLREQLKPISERIMKKILILAIQWKVGKPQIKIRKAGIINMIALINHQIINQEQLLDCFKQLLPPLKSCLSDDWAPQLRFACCQLLEKLLLVTRDNIGDDQLRELYPSLLERLDDSQDPIRKKITTAINVFFTCRYLKFSSSTLEYMINSIFVHFDDNNEEIQSAIATTLRFAAKVDPKQVLNAASINVKRMKHQQKCQQIIEYCKQIIQQNQL